MEKYYNNYKTQSRTLEITIISGEDLRINKRPIKKHAYVIVRSAMSDDSRCTGADGDGGSYPAWNEKLELHAPPRNPAAVLTVEVRCRTAFGDKAVGTASVPASDFSGGYIPETHLRFLSYRLRDSAGERNGIINISVRTRLPAMEEQKTIVGMAVGNRCDSDNVVTGFPVWTMSHDNNSNSGKYF